MTKRYAIATEKNRQPILEILKEIIPFDGNILEIASGSGQHSLFFAPYFSQQQWIPSDKEKECLDSIKAWREGCLTDNLELPLKIDVMESNWYQGLKDKNIKVMVCINMIHISPWEACLGLMTAAREILLLDGILYLYGAYKINNQHTATSNQEFDKYLRSQNPAWGVRNLEDIIEVAGKNNLTFEKKIPMPSNNFSLIFRKIS